MIAKGFGIFRTIGFLIIGLAVWNLSAQTASNVAKHAPVIAKWSAQTSSIEKILKNQAICSDPDGFYVQVLDTFGSTGNGPSVALVDYCAAGAYTDSIMVMQMEHGQPVIARFRDKNGQSIPAEFLSGASVMHSVDVEFCLGKRAICDEFADRDSEGKLSRCGVKAYVWNPKTGTFDASQRQSKIASRDYCRLVRKQTIAP